jgi:hypothetical protein
MDIVVVETSVIEKAIFEYFIHNSFYKVMIFSVDETYLKDYQ